MRKQAMMGLNGIRLLIVDIDGVICCNNAAAPGASEAITRLREHGLVIKFLTNDAISSRYSRAQELNALGFDIHPSDIYTAASLTADYLRQMGNPQTMMLVEGEAIEEFQGIPIVEHDPQVVVVADFFGSYSFDKLNRAFLSIRAGAHFIAMQRNQYCSAGGLPTIDVGFWVAGLEYCTGITAEVIGKPSVKSYLSICRDVAIKAEQAAMLSDDLSSDLLGAHQAGLITIHLTDYSVLSSSSTFNSPNAVVSNLSEFIKLVHH
jgi:HAD superfamily hydrolase (TIGR01458 family)